MKFEFQFSIVYYTFLWLENNIKKCAVKRTLKNVLSVEDELDGNFLIDLCVFVFLCFD